LLRNNYDFFARNSQKSEAGAPEKPEAQQGTEKDGKKTDAVVNDAEDDVAKAREKEKKKNRRKKQKEKAKAGKGIAKQPQAAALASPQKKSQTQCAPETRDIPDAGSPPQGLAGTPSPVVVAHSHECDNENNNAHDNINTPPRRESLTHLIVPETPTEGTPSRNAGQVAFTLVPEDLIKPDSSLVRGVSVNAGAAVAAAGGHAHPPVQNHGSRRNQRGADLERARRWTVTDYDQAEEDAYGNAWDSIDYSKEIDPNDRCVPHRPYPRTIRVCTSTGDRFGNSFVKVWEIDCEKAMSVTEKNVNTALFFADSTVPSNSDTRHADEELQKHLKSNDEGLALSTDQGAPSPSLKQAPLQIEARHILREGRCFDHGTAFARRRLAELKSELKWEQELDIATRPQDTGVDRGVVFFAPDQIKCAACASLDAGRNCEFCRMTGSKPPTAGGAPAADRRDTEFSYISSTAGFDRLSESALPTETHDHIGVTVSPAPFGGINVKDETGKPLPTTPTTDAGSATGSVGGNARGGTTSPATEAPQGSPAQGTGKDSSSSSSASPQPGGTGCHPEPAQQPSQSSWEQLQDLGALVSSQFSTSILDSLVFPSTNNCGNNCIEAENGAQGGRRTSIRVEESNEAVSRQRRPEGLEDQSPETAGGRGDGVNVDRSLVQTPGRLSALSARGAPYNPATEHSRPWDLDTQSDTRRSYTCIDCEVHPVVSLICWYKDAEAAAPEHWYRGKWFYHVPLWYCFPDALKLIGIKDATPGSTGSQQPKEKTREVFQRCVRKILTAQRAWRVNHRNVMNATPQNARHPAAATVPPAGTSPDGSPPTGPTGNNGISPGATGEHNTQAGQQFTGVDSQGGQQQNSCSRAFCDIPEGKASFPLLSVVQIYNSDIVRVMDNTDVWTRVSLFGRRKFWQWLCNSRSHEDVEAVIKSDIPVWPCHFSIMLHAALDSKKPKAARSFCDKFLKGLVTLRKRQLRADSGQANGLGGNSLAARRGGSDSWTANTLGSLTARGSWELGDHILDDPGLMYAVCCLIARYPEIGCDFLRKFDYIPTVEEYVELKPGPSPTDEANGGARKQLRYDFRNEDYLVKGGPFLVSPGFWREKISTHGSFSKDDIIWRRVLRYTKFYERKNKTVAADRREIADSMVLPFRDAVSVKSVKGTEFERQYVNGGGHSLWDWIQYAVYRWVWLGLLVGLFGRSICHTRTLWRWCRRRPKMYEKCHYCGTPTLEAVEAMDRAGQMEAERAGQGGKYRIFARDQLCLECQGHHPGSRPTRGPPRISIKSQEGGQAVPMNKRSSQRSMCSSCCGSNVSNGGWPLEGDAAMFPDSSATGDEGIPQNVPKGSGKLVRRGNSAVEDSGSVPDAGVVRIHYVLEVGKYFSFLY